MSWKGFTHRFTYLAYAGHTVVASRGNCHCHNSRDIAGHPRAERAGTWERAARAEKQHTIALCVCIGR